MRVVCIDDEDSALRLLERQLEKNPEIEVVGTFTNPLEGLDFILRNEVEVVFLDIDMSPINGMGIAEKILEKLPETIIVSVTAYESYAVDAFELDAIDYILKPVKAIRLRATVDRIHKQAGQMKNAKPHDAILKISLAPLPAFEVGSSVFENLSWRTENPRNCSFLSC